MTGAVLSAINIGEVVAYGAIVAAVGGGLYLASKYREYFGEATTAGVGGDANPRGVVKTDLPGRGATVTIEHPKEDGWFINGILDRYGPMGSGDGQLIMAVIKNPTIFKPPINGSEGVEKKPPGSLIVLIGSGEARDVWLSQMKHMESSAEEFAEKIRLGEDRSIGMFSDFVGT